MSKSNVDCTVCSGRDNLKSRPTYFALDEMSLSRLSQVDVIDQDDPSWTSLELDFFQYHQLYLDQKYYLEKVLKKFKMAKSKFLSTLVSQGTVLSKNMCPKNKEEQEFMENVPYAQAVGSLMYAMTSTRPYICHTV